jgi:hypothetical protein
MLVRVTRTVRRRAATIIAALYALCVLMPAAALALGSADGPVHCFTEQQLGLHVHQPVAAHGHSAAHGRVHQMQAGEHVHAGHAPHRHDQSHPPGISDRSDHPATCCGLFGVTAMAVDPQLDLGAPSRQSAILPVSFEELTGRGPDRINRPPIVLLPL